MPHQNLISYQQPGPRGANTENNIRLLTVQVNDVVDLRVFADDIETAKPFNIVPDSDNSTSYSKDLVQLKGYLVDQSGAINFPILGRIVLKGLTMAEVKTLLAERLKPYLKNPVINVRILNFKVTISGEVMRPGVFTILDQRITLPEALALAGDLTDYANRSNVLLVREVDGVKTHTRINLKSADFFDAPYYYLQQNDLVYIEPVKAKTGAVRDRTSKSIPIITSAITLVIVMISTFKKD